MLNKIDIQVLEQLELHDGLESVPIHKTNASYLAKIGYVSLTKPPSYFDRLKNRDNLVPVHLTDKGRLFLQDHGLEDAQFDLLLDSSDKILKSIGVKP